MNGRTWGFLSERNIRIKPAERALIDQAAAMQGKSRTDFMLDASRRAAEETLLDQTLLRVDRTTYDRFVEPLDAPPRPNAQLRKLMQTKALWDQAAGTTNRLRAPSC